MCQISTGDVPPMAMLRLLTFATITSPECNHLSMKLFTGICPCFIVYQSSPVLQNHDMVKQIVQVLIFLLGAQVKIRSDLIKVNSVILVLILPSLSDLWAPVWNRGVWVCTQPRSDSCGTEGILPPDISKNLGMTLMTDSCRHVSFLKQLFVCHKQQRSLCLSVS